MPHKPGRADQASMAGDMKPRVRFPDCDTETVNGANGRSSEDETRLCGIPT